jgi:hypothetical protein
MDDGDAAMDRWDVLVIIVAGYVSVVSLTRLMAQRRNELIAKIRDEIAKQRTRGAAAAAAQDDEHQEAA